MSLDYSTNRFSPLSSRHRETDRGVSCGTRVSSTLSGIQGQTAVFNFKLPTAPAPVRVLCCLHPLLSEPGVVEYCPIFDRARYAREPAQSSQDVPWRSNQVMILPHLKVDDCSAPKILFSLLIFPRTNQRVNRPFRALSPALRPWLDMQWLFSLLGNTLETQGHSRAGVARWKVDYTQGGFLAQRLPEVREQGLSLNATLAFGNSFIKHGLGNL